MGRVVLSKEAPYRTLVDREVPYRESPCRGLIERAAPCRKPVGRGRACKEVVFRELAPNMMMLKIKARVEIWLNNVLSLVPYCSLQTMVPLAGGLKELFENSSNSKLMISSRLLTGGRISRIFAAGY